MLNFKGSAPRDGARLAVVFARRAGALRLQMDYADASGFALHHESPLDVDIARLQASFGDREAAAAGNMVRDVVPTLQLCMERAARESSTVGLPIGRDVVQGLGNGETIGRALHSAQRTLAREGCPLGLAFTYYGDADARLP